MAPDPFIADTHAIRTHGVDLSNAADNAASALSDSLGSAASARPGFPGAAAGPFDSMLGALATKDKALVEAIASAGEGVTAASMGYDRCEEQNTQQLDTIRIEFLN